MRAILVPFVCALGLHPIRLAGQLPYGCANADGPRLIVTSVDTSRNEARVTLSLLVRHVLQDRAPKRAACILGRDAVADFIGPDIPTSGDYQDILRLLRANALVNILVLDSVPEIRARVIVYRQRGRTPDTLPAISARSIRQAGTTIADSLWADATLWQTVIKAR